MKKQESNKPSLARIISIDGSDLLKRGFSALRDGKLNPDAFRGLMDQSLDTLKLAEVYRKHRAELPFPYLADKQFCRAVVNVSFDYAVKQFEQYGRRFVRYGHTVADADMTDHVCVRDGELIAIEVPYQKDTRYEAVRNPVDAELLGNYFEYDAEARVYRRSKAAIPSAVTRRAVREKLYADGFTIDGVHYVRYKRSAGASRDGRCMFIAEPHITMGNHYLAMNHTDQRVQQYFNLTPNIVYVNSIQNNIQHRLNGCDFDSDTMLATFDIRLARGVVTQYHEFSVPVCSVKPIGKTTYSDTPSGYAKLDSDISENKIGEIVNLSQFLNCLLWDAMMTRQNNIRPKTSKLNLYYDICKLAVLSGMEIDKAKRMYAVDTDRVLRKLGEYRRNFKKATGGHLPEFFLSMTRNPERPAVGKSAHLECPMAYIYDLVTKYRGKAKRTKTIPLSELFALSVSDLGANDTHKKQNVITAVKDAYAKINSYRTDYRKDTRWSDPQRESALYVAADQTGRGSVL